MSGEPASVGDDFILARLKQHGIRHVEFAGRAPSAPLPYTSAYLDHLNRYAIELSLDHPEAPLIRRDGDRFVLVRQKPEKRQTRYQSIRTALKKVLFELAMKREGESRSGRGRS